MTAPEDMSKVLHGVDASRRAGWAKYYELRDAVALMIDAAPGPVPKPPTVSTDDATPRHVWAECFRFKWERALRLDNELYKTHRLIIMSVGTFLDLNGVGFVSMKQVSTAVNLSEVTVKRGMTVGRDRGWMLRTRRGTNGYASEYRLTIPEKFATLESKPLTG